jgi:hypothetical protein
MGYEFGGQKQESGRILVFFVPFLTSHGSFRKLVRHESTENLVLRVI